VKVFTSLFNAFEKLSNHKFATYIMCANSFFESIFWPVPADVMLVPMCVCHRSRSMYYAFLTVLFSVLGAVVGYYLGYYLFDPYIKDFILLMHYQNSMSKAAEYLEAYSIFFVFIGAFTPIPYKVIAITTGLVAAQRYADIGSTGALSILSFIAVSIVGRGLRFFLEAIVIYLGGEKMESAIRKYIDLIGWTCVGIFCIFIAYKILI
jgi:membrane protein YqaA with SNARE-associated domain